jgi:hypothetical protein
LQLKHLQKRQRNYRKKPLKKRAEANITEIPNIVVVLRKKRMKREDLEDKVQEGEVGAEAKGNIKNDVFILD